MNGSRRAFLQRAALASAVAIPVLASGAVLLAGDGDEPAASDEQAPCDGCREVLPRAELVRGEADTRWCNSCVRDAQIISEDDGEP